MEIFSLPTEKLAMAIPMLMVAGGVLITAVTVLAVQWRKARQLELETSLKSQMLERGMSAAEIERVMEAGRDTPPMDASAISAYERQARS